MRRIYFIISLCVVFSATIIYLLVINSRSVPVGGGFQRFYKLDALIELNKVDAGHTYYVAGVSKSNIYLVRYSSRGNVLVMNHALQETSNLKLISLGYDILSPRIAVDSPYFYIIEGRSSTILAGTLDKREAFSISGKIPKFGFAEPISLTSSIAVVYDTLSKQNQLAKLLIDSPYVVVAKNGLERQIDGVFCVDGMLRYDPITAKLVYLYYYRNQFVLLDTNLNLLSRAKTIDTISRAKIDVVTAQSKRVTDVKMATLRSTSSLMVNKGSCVSNGYLFVYSNLISEGESLSYFQSNSVFDVYSLSDNRYVFSFGVPKISGEGVNSFRVHDHKMFVTIGHVVVAYKLVSD